MSEHRLAPCPYSPNCVSSLASDRRHAIEPILVPEGVPPARARAIVKEILLRQPRTRLVREEDDYLSFECRSRVFRFVDDVEFVLDRAAGRIDLRSASRVGYYDFGNNRERMLRLILLITNNLNKI